MAEERVVAVEEALADVTAALRERGYRVVDPGRGRDARVVVLSGQDVNVTGVSGVARPAPVVVARGRTAREVADEVDRRYPRTGPLL